MQTPRNGQELVSYPAEWSASDEHFCLLNEESMSCLSLHDGALVWQVKTGTVVPGSQGCLARVEGRVLWWRVALGRLDALDEVTGKLLWTSRIPPLAEKPASNANNPVWLTSGIRADRDRVLVLGNGTALARVDDRMLLWKVSTAAAPISFPLELDETKTASAVMGQPLIATGFSRVCAGFNSVTLSHQMAMPSYGYPGMYGSAQSSPWLLWGGDRERWLQGDGIWMLGQNIISARYSVLGLPVTSSASRSGSSLNSALPIGTVGRALVAVTETAVLKVLPEGEVKTLSSSEFRDNRPAKHPLPAVALDGHIIGMATADHLSVVDAVSGSLLWKIDWPKDAQPIIQEARESLNVWQNLRWSSRGVSFYVGQARTLTVEWHALMAGGDLIVPIGTRTLMGLRCQP